MPGGRRYLGSDAACRKESIMDPDIDVGARDFRFGVTGLGIIVLIAIVLAIVS